MGKRGSTKHMKRIAVPKAVPITNKKEYTWIKKPVAGPHPRERCISLGVLLRDILHVASSTREIRRILTGRKVLVDGKARTEEKFPVGFMDIISFPDSKKHYRITVDWKGRLVPVEIDAKETGAKLLKVTGKHTAPKGKIVLELHDGRTLYGDNHVKVGDSILLKIPKQELATHMKLESGSRCLVQEGKHAGKIIKLREILRRKGGKRPEVLVEGEDGNFETVLEYLFVIGKDFEVNK